MEPREFGKYLREIRKENNLTIRQVELYAEVSNSYISQLENGKRGIPSPDVLKKLAKVYKVNYEDLMKKAGYIDSDIKISDPVMTDDEKIQFLKEALIKNNIITENDVVDDKHIKFLTDMFILTRKKSE